LITRLSVFLLFSSTPIRKTPPALPARPAGAEESPEVAAAAAAAAPAAVTASPTKKKKKKKRVGGKRTHTRPQSVRLPVAPPQMEVQCMSSETNAEGVIFEEWEVVNDPDSLLAFEKQIHRCVFFYLPLHLTRILLTV
jgi:hypothetical protein